LTHTAEDPARADEVAKQYLQLVDHIPLEAHEREFEGFIRRIGKFVPITSATRILEIGVGSGWFPVMCGLRGLRCEGLELHQSFIDYARQLGARYGVELDIDKGNVETYDLGEERYDVVLATSVFEHVRDYRRGLANVYRALKPGGVLYFYSTNRFSLRSGEFPGLPLYGWLPDRLRYRFRVWRHGPAIIETSGIDFNQFTYWGLKREFNRIGFRKMYDRTQFIAGDDDIVVPRRWKAFVVRMAKIEPFRTVARAFASGNAFICVK